MSRRTAVCVLALVAMIGFGLIAETLAQAADPPAGGQPGARSGRQPRGGNRQPMTPEEMQKRMEEFRKRASDQMKTTMGSTDEEWKVLQPLFEKVQTAQRALRGGGRGGFTGGRRGGPGGGTTPPAPGAAVREQSAIEKAQAALRTVTEKKDATPEEIKAALDAYRSARDKAKDELATAQKALREVLTKLQEAKCVLAGLLD